jgi:hypothetical protein
LAVDRINEEFTQSIPPDYDTFVAMIGQIYQAVLARRSALRVLAHDMILDPEQPPSTRIALPVIADLIRAHRAEHGIQSAVEPEVIAACLGAVAWGLTLFGNRWRLALGLAEIPNDQVATVLRAILEA